jgi:predicted peptidase
MAPQETGFLNRTVRVNGNDYPYAVYVPRGFDRARKWPVILFLHGSGERGSDGLRPSQVGLGAAIRFDPSGVPAIVVFPHAPLDTRWIGEPADAAIAALDRSIEELNGDRERTYLTGLSMGGYGAIHLALAEPRRFAALVIVCGGLLPHPTTTAVQRSPLIPAGADPYAFVAQSLRSVPIWLFHGAADPVIPIDEARHLDEELKKAGATVRYTEYPEVGHNAWDRAYGEAGMWSWLFAQRRG